MVYYITADDGPRISVRVRGPFQDRALAEGDLAGARAELECIDPDNVWRGFRVTSSSVDLGCGYLDDLDRCVCGSRSGFGFATL